MPAQSKPSATIVGATGALADKALRCSRGNAQDAEQRMRAHDLGRYRWAAGQRIRDRTDRQTAPRSQAFPHTAERVAAATASSAAAEGACGVRSGAQPPPSFK